MIELRHVAEILRFIGVARQVSILFDVRIGGGHLFVRCVKGHVEKIGLRGFASS